LQSKGLSYWLLLLENMRRVVEVPVDLVERTERDDLALRVERPEATDRFSSMYRSSMHFGQVSSRTCVCGVDQSVHEHALNINSVVHNCKEQLTFHPPIIFFLANCT
jgi:hypothetical protein